MKKLLGEDYRSAVEKRSRIKSWDRLIGLSQTKNYNGKQLDDRSHEGNVHCVKTWLSLNDQNFVQQGNTFIITHNYSEIVFDVSYTLGLSAQQVKIKETVESQNGEYFILTEFSEFLKQWDKYF